MFQDLQEEILSIMKNLVNPVSVWLTFGVLENGVADFDAVGDREDARLLAFPSVFRQHDPVRRKRLLHCSIIKEFAGVLYGSATRIALFILQPKHAQRSGADVVPSLPFFFVEQVYDEKIEPFLLLLPDESYRRTALFVAQQRVDTVVMLRDETGGGVLSRSKRRAVDESPEFPISKNQ